MMNKSKRPWFCAAMAVAMVMLLGSCDTIMGFLENSPVADFLGLGTDEENDSNNGAVSFANPNIFIGVGESNISLGHTTTPANAAVLWSSEKVNIATVDQNGKVTGVAAGTTKITAAPAGGNAATVSVTVANVIDVYNATDWDTAFTTISSASGNPALYILKIQDNFDVQGRTTPNITGEYKKVRLIGDKTVSLSSPGSIIQTAKNQTYIFDGPTFVGMAGNNRPVVYLDSGSAELKSGAISGNSTSSNGGGVYMRYGTFMMSGGTISGNSTSSTKGGGGVYTDSNTASFTMSGGVISGNTASSETGDGGGVYMYYGTFTMGGGEISGNTAIDFGGGVYVVTSTVSFTMNGGTIYGSNDPTLKNTANNEGAAVYIKHSSEGIENTIHSYPQ